MFSLHTLPMSIYYECNTLSPHIKFCSTHFEASQRLMIENYFWYFWTVLRPSDGKIGDLMVENRSPKMSKICLHLRSKKNCSSFFLNKGSILTGSALPVVALRSTYYQPFVILCSNFRCLDRSLIPTLIFF